MLKIEPDFGRVEIMDSMKKKYLDQYQSIIDMLQR
jgi:hypothetical protein